MARAKLPTTEVPTSAPEPLWLVGPADADGMVCHSLVVRRDDVSVDDTFDRAKRFASERISALSLSCNPPGIVGRGDHVYVEIHARTPAAAPQPVVTYVINVSGSLAPESLDGHVDRGSES